MNIGKFLEKSTTGSSHIIHIQIIIGTQSHIHISNIFDQTAFDKLASISHFLDAFIDNKVSGIEVIPAKSTKATISGEIHKFVPIKLAECTDNSTPT